MNKEGVTDLFAISKFECIMMGTQKPGGTPNLLRRKFWLLKFGNPKVETQGGNPNPTFATRTHHLSSINLKISFFFFSFLPNSQ